MTLDEARRYVLDAARARGIGAEIIGERGRELTAKAHQHQIEQITEAVVGGVGVRVVIDGRVGYGYSEDLSPEALDWMLAEAAENAALQTDTSGFLPEGVDLGTHDLVGDGLAAPLESKVQTALGFEGTLREDKRVKQVMFASYSEREVDLSLASTQGADGRYRRGVAGLIASVIMQDGQSLKQSWDADWVRNLESLDPAHTALDFTQRTGRLLGARPLPTGRYTAYFEPKAFAHLLSAFWSLWSGKAAIEGKSRLANRLGQRVASAAFTLIDDPTLADGLATRPFDSEGTPARPVTLVEDGVLRTFFTSSETARALALPNTGHAARSYRSVLTTLPSNLYVKPGGGLRMETGVIVAELSGVHAGTNAISGDFSVQALGLWVENGQVAYAVENFAVAGDFLSLLMNITGIDAVLKWELMGRMAIGTPTIEVADLSFAGI
ncbi:MAG TPA: metallopeptidase TldD-related protein [bacterium]